MNAMDKQPATVADIETVPDVHERGLIASLIHSQEFWILLAVIAIGLMAGWIAPNFLSAVNLSNMSINFCFIALIAIGMTPVIMTGGIDISVGSTLGLCGVMVGMTLAAGHSFLVGALVVVLVGAGVGFVSGFFIAYVKLAPFIVTLAMMSTVRALTLVVTNNQVIHDFGPAQDTLLTLGAGNVFGIPNVLWAVVILAALMQFFLTMTKWGRYVRAVGGNESSARMTGIPVTLIKISVYMLVGAITGLTALFLVGWMGAATNALGQGFELQVIAGAVIGGANLLGGFGSAIGAVIGSLLLEVIRNALLLAGVNPFWQGLFVGAFILFAILLERFRSLRT